MGDKRYRITLTEQQLRVVRVALEEYFRLRLGQDMGKMNVFRCDKYEMSDEEAKRVILSDPHGNILKRMEAIVVARSVLGEDCTMEDIWKWAEK